MVIWINMFFVYVYTQKLCEMVQILTDKMWNLLDAVVDMDRSNMLMRVCDAFCPCAACKGDMRHFRLAAVLKVQYSHSYTNYITYCTVYNVIKLQPLLIFIVVSTVHLYDSRYSGMSTHCTVCYAVVVMKNYGYYEMSSVDILVIVAPTVAILRHFCNQDWKLQP
jgi:hypothetical protein